jgi:O-antigen ligase
MTKGVIAILILWAYACMRALLNPWVGFIGYTVFVVLCPRWNWRWGWNDSVDYQKFLAGGTVAGVLLTGALFKPLNATAKASVAFFTIFLALVWVSSFNTMDVFYTTRFLDIIWKIWLMAILGVWLIDDQKKLVWFIWAFMLSQGWNAFNVNQLYYERGGINVNNFSWNYLDNNTYSISSVPVMGVVFGVLMVVKDWRLRLLTGLIFVLQMHQLMILQSRGTMVGGLCLVALGVFFMPKTRVSIQMTLIATVLGVLLAGPSVVKEFMSSFEAAESIDSSADSRYKLWKAGAAIMRDNPLLGVGPWAGQFVVPRYYEGNLDGMGQKALHNLFFEIGTGSGIPAVIAYLLYFFIPWFGHLKLWRQGIPRPGSWEQAVNVGYLCGVPGYWAASMFSSGALIEPPYLMVTLGCVGLQLAIDSRDQEDDSEGQDEEDFEDQEFSEYIGVDDELENHGYESERHSVIK